MLLFPEIVGVFLLFVLLLFFSVFLELFPEIVFFNAFLFSAVVEAGEGEPIPRRLGTSRILRFRSLFVGLVVGLPNLTQALVTFSRGSEDRPENGC